MKIKRFFSFPTFPLAAAFLSLSAAVPLMAELPEREYPLDGEFTTSSNEQIYAATTRTYGFGNHFFR